MFHSRSSIFCQKVIKDFVEPEYTMSLLLAIAGKLKSTRGSCIHSDLLKSCFKFSTIEKLLPDENKLKNIVNYYEKLKRIVSWLINDPHFWLQYAMGHISCGDYVKAQKLLDNAYGKAKTKPNYYVENIDTQQARLYILKARQAETTTESLEMFKQGHKKLMTVQNSRYKYRQVYLYEKFYNAINVNLDVSSKKMVLKFCNEMIGSIISDTQSTESSEGYMKNAAIAQLKNITTHINKTDDEGFSPSSIVDL